MNFEQSYQVKHLNNIFTITGVTVTLKSLHMNNNGIIKIIVTNVHKQLKVVWGSQIHWDKGISFVVTIIDVSWCKLLYFPAVSKDQPFVDALWGFPVKTTSKHDSHGSIGINRNWISDESSSESLKHWKKNSCNRFECSENMLASP